MAYAARIQEWKSIRLSSIQARIQRHKGHTMKTKQLKEVCSIQDLQAAALMQPWTGNCDNPLPIMDVGYGFGLGLSLNH